MQRRLRMMLDQPVDQIVPLVAHPMIQIVGKQLATHVLIFGVGSELMCQIGCYIGGGLLGVRPFPDVSIRDFVWGHLRSDLGLYRPLNLERGGIPEESKRSRTESDSRDMSKPRYPLSAGVLQDAIDPTADESH